MGLLVLWPTTLRGQTFAPQREYQPLVVEASVLNDWVDAADGTRLSVHVYQNGKFVNIPFQRDLDELRTGSWVGATCLTSQTAVPSASDSRVPTDGAGFWYRVRARNACGNGTYGAVGLDAASPCP